MGGPTQGGGQTRLSGSPGQCGGPPHTLGSSVRKHHRSSTDAQQALPTIPSNADAPLPTMVCMQQELVMQLSGDHMVTSCRGGGGSQGSMVLQGGVVSPLTR
jgi:hypothetical protein